MDILHIILSYFHSNCGEARVTTNNRRLQMVCSFIDTHSKYTTCIMRSLRWSSCCYWLTVDCDGRATVVEALLLEILLGVLALHWDSLDRACCSAMSDEAREFVLAGSHLSLRCPARIVCYIAIYRTYRANTRTALIELSIWTAVQSSS
jgi:hypothetical protein